MNLPTFRPVRRDLRALLTTRRTWEALPADLIKLIGEFLIRLYVPLWTGYTFANITRAHNRVAYCGHIKSDGSTCSEKWTDESSSFCREHLVINSRCLALTKNREQCPRTARQ